jgi:hypothetical protein
VRTRWMDGEKSKSVGCMLRTDSVFSLLVSSLSIPILISVFAILFDVLCVHLSVTLRDPSGLFIPALPPKKALGILDDDFLVERMIDLGDFLVRVSAHGMLRDCAAFRYGDDCIGLFTDGSPV